MVRIRRATGVVVGCIWLALAGSAGLLAMDIIDRDRGARDRVTARTGDELDAALARLQTIVVDVTAATGELEAAVRATARNGGDVADHLVTVIRRYPVLGAVGAAYGPFVHDDRHRLFAPVVTRLETGDLNRGRIDAAYDYTQGYAWYRDALKAGDAWSAPDTGERGGRPMLTYSRRVDLGPGRAVVVFAALPIEPLSAALAAMNLGEHGYGILLSGDGHVMDYPDDRFTRDLVSVTELAGGEDRSVGRKAAEERGYFARLAENALTGSGANPGSGTCGFTAESPVTRQQSDVTCRRLAETGWLVAAVVGHDDLPVDHRQRHRDLLLLTALCVLALLVLPFLDRLIRGALLGNWTWSLVSTLILAAGIGAIWHWNMTESLRRSGEHTVVGAADVERIRHQWLRRAVLASHDLPRFVPTGVFVQSVEFLSANNLLVTGYVWQRVAEGAEPVGFVLPEAETMEIEEAYRRTAAGETVVGWEFRVTLRQRFGYSRYPFDWETVWVRLWPDTFDDNIILIPDLDAYRIMNPGTLPGVDRDLFIGGWSAMSSYFEYRTNGYATNFGVDEDGVLQGRPELYFTILIRRNFIDPFISNLTPIALVLLLIFAMLMTIKREARYRELLGFNAATIITTCAALFFAVLISHIEVRSALSATRIFYLEYFYFITYGAILLVCVNSILFTHDRPFSGIDYRDNLLPKLFFWPMVLAAMFTVTLLVFL